LQRAVGVRGVGAHEVQATPGRAAVAHRDLELGADGDRPGQADAQLLSVVFEAAVAASVDGHFIDRHLDRVELEGRELTPARRELEPRDAGEPRAREIDFELEADVIHPDGAVTLEMRLRARRGEWAWHERNGGGILRGYRVGGQIPTARRGRCRRPRPRCHGLQPTPVLKYRP
jgi:hypothetical protein